MTAAPSEAEGESFEAMDHQLSKNLFVDQRIRDSIWLNRYVCWKTGKYDSLVNSRMFA